MNILVILSLAAGIFFFAVGVIGLLRLPDVFCRMHATTKCDTLGAGLILFSLMLHRGLLSAESIKLLFIIIFIWLTNPTSAHIIAKAAYRNKAEMAPGSFDIDYTKEESA